MNIAWLPGKIEIVQWPNDHLPPHFHAIQAEEEVLIRIASLTVYHGAMNRRVRHCY